MQRKRRKQRKNEQKGKKSGANPDMNMDANAGSGADVNANTDALALRNAGLRATPKRLAIIGELRTQSKPMSVSGIMRALGRRMNQTTVYRATEALSQSGFLKRVDLRHGHRHYELGEGREHHHIICNGCGKVEELLYCRGNAMQKAALKRSKDFSAVDAHELEFFGRCKRCAAHP